MNITHPKILPLVYLGIATIAVVLPMSKEQYWPRLSEEEQAIEYAVKLRQRSMIAKEPMLFPSLEPQQEDALQAPKQPAQRPSRSAPAVMPSSPEQTAIAVSHFRVRDRYVQREILKEREIRQ